MTKAQITIRTGGSFWMVSIDGKTTDIGVKVTDGYRVYKRAGECGIAIADRLGNLIGTRLKGKEGEADFLATIADFLATIAAIL